MLEGHAIGQLINRNQLMGIGQLNNKNPNNVVIPNQYEGTRTKAVVIPSHIQLIIMRMI